MPVIGRLDDQVEAILINPLRRRDAPGEEARDEPELPAAPAEDTEHKSPDESSRERHQGEAASSLPVWLL